MSDSVQSLSEALLAELAMHAEPVSTARLTKKLGVRMSSLLRCVAYLSEDLIGEQAGPGWVRLIQDGERTLLALTDKGRAARKGQTEGEHDANRSC
ncbi:hypothetical protein [Undibacterium sp.]|jgi:hypothetical protein|uniref:hypothetical protein n=1 Tax=Undibacterium sp. TaxID=1914977 RepID=UPI002C6CCB16|nr:hypothetical protein [Undibacterium sp.]HTD07110.1 hypothetical protein [Undibacterium sp.]